MGIADQAYREWQVRKTELLQTNARLRALLKRETEKSDADHQRLVDTVSGQLVRFIREIDNALPKDAADSLRRGITEIVRPLSRQMDAVNYQEAPPEGEDGKVSWRQVSPMFARPARWSRCWCQWQWYWWPSHLWR